MSGFTIPTSANQMMEDRKSWLFNLAVMVRAAAVVCMTMTAHSQDFIVLSAADADPSHESIAGDTTPASEDVLTSKSDVVANEKSSEEFRKLLTDTFEANWLIFASDPSAPSVWSLRKELLNENDPTEELILVCSGAVKGFAYSKEKFGDFELTLDWRFPKDDSGNSGVLMFTQAEPRIWPTSLQLQLHQPTAGCLIPSGDAKTDMIQDAEGSLARPVGQWNECRIVCLNGTVAVEINGKKAGQVSGATPNSGSIALQSEGSEVHFRRIQIRPIKRSPNSPSQSKEQ